MTDMTYRLNRREILYLTSLMIYIAVMLLSYTAIQENSAFVQLSKYVRYACYLLAVIKIILDFIDKKSFWIICIVIALITIVSVQMDSNNYLFYLIMIVAARDVNIREIIKSIFIVQSAILIIIVFASQIGWVENYFFLQSGRNRYGLGFLYTTFAPALFCFIMMAYIYLREDRMRIYEYVILEGINYWFYYMTDSRMIFYLSTIMLVYVFLMRYFWQNRKERIRKNRWLILAPSIACVGSILLHVFYNQDNEIMYSLNSFFNGRLSLGRDALSTYGITLFGQNIKWVNHVKLSDVGTYNFVDSSYLKLLLDGGIVALLLVVAAYTYIMYMAVKLNNYYLQTVLLFTIILCITETRLVNLPFNAFLILVAAAWRTKPLEDLDKQEQSYIHRFRLRTNQIRLKSRC